MQISDAGELEALIAAVMGDHPKELGEYRGGKVKLKGFFQGQVIKRSGGRANPTMVEKLLMKCLDQK